MGRITPQAHLITHESRMYYRNYDKHTESEYRFFKTYRELKKNMKNMLKETVDNNVFVVRYKRGQWGEWCETWKLINDKPKIVKEGWS